MIAPLLVIVGLAGVSHALAVSRYSAFNRAGLVGSQGRISSGRKFGVGIGDDYHAVARAFGQLGFEERELTKPHSCHSFAYAAHLTPHLWFDNSWRKGTLCVVTSGDRVVYLSWAYGFGFP